MNGLMYFAVSYMFSISFWLQIYDMNEIILKGPITGSLKIHFPSSCPQ